MSYFVEEQAEENERFAETIRLLRSRVRAADMAMLDMSGARDRYRLAWMSARQRAANHLAALVESDDRRDRLEIELNHWRQVITVELMAERDEARAEVVRLGKQSEARRVYVAMVADRHLDPAPYLFSDLDAALTFVKAEALKLVESERYIEEVTGDGFLYMANCGNEGDYVWVVEREIDGGAPDA